MLEYKLIKATPTLIKTPNCLDDIMATLFENIISIISSSIEIV